ncbi:TPA: IS200/IS605 family transposase [Salmonella enterica]|nr:IS200/IS605 family transposase [Salmonella enterica]
MLWCCQYYIVWTPKCQFRILRNNVGKEVCKQFRISGEQLGIEIVELNIQLDYVHLLVKIPPKLSISHVVGHLNVAVL